LLAEALRAFEDDGRRPVNDDAEATAAGRSVEGDTERRIVARAKATSVSGALAHAISRTHGMANLLVFALLLVLMVVGAGAAQAALGAGAEARVNFFHALGTLIGVQTLALALWCLLMIARPRAMRSFSLGAVLNWVLGAVMRRSSRSLQQAAAVQAVSAVHAAPRLARWTLSGLSHAAWLSFNIGSLTMLLFLLSTRSYAFVWETTILSERAYAPLVDAVATVPKLAGFRAPTPEQVAASEWRTESSTNIDAQITPMDSSMRHAWSSLLVGSIVMYGALPRALLLCFCIWRLMMAHRHYRLDLAQPGFALLAVRLAPNERRLGVIDPDDVQHDDRSAGAADPHKVRPSVSPAIVGIELEQSSAWPPRLARIQCADLGVINDRFDRRRIVQQLATAQDEPAVLVIACSITTTPDRGMAAMIAELRGAISRPTLLVLTGGQAMRDRTDVPALQARVADWRSLASAAGIPSDNVLEVDFEHATSTSLAQLAAHIEAAAGSALPRDGVGNQTEPRAQRRIESAFLTIVEHAGRWSGVPSEKQQLALHQDIWRIYGDAPARWRALVRHPADAAALTKNAAASLRVHADGIVSLLPPQLRIRPAWAVAGATAGAMGCLAAAALAAPAVIGALPIWTAIGAVIAASSSAWLHPAGSTARSDAEQGSRSRADAVRAAALAAMLLELQGRGEGLISEVLERTLDGMTIDALEQDSSIASVQTWLDDVRHRFDLALVEVSDS